MSSFIIFVSYSFSRKGKINKICNVFIQYWKVIKWDQIYQSSGEMRFLLGYHVSQFSVLPSDFEEALNSVLHWGQEFFWESHLSTHYWWNRWRQWRTLRTCLSSYSWKQIEHRSSWLYSAFAGLQVILGINSIS